MDPLGPTVSDIKNSNKTFNVTILNCPNEETFLAQEGRESLGILPSNFEIISNLHSDSLIFKSMQDSSNQRKESESGFSNNMDKTFNAPLLNSNVINTEKDSFLNSLQEGRESLGILPPNFDKDLNFSNLSNRDSVFFKNCLYFDHSDQGRESLGILQMDNLDYNLGNENDELPQISYSLIEKEFSDKSNKLDTAFLLASPNNGNNLNSDVFSFNSNSLEYPSKICSEFSNSTKSPSASSFLNNARFISLSQMNMRPRFFSQPFVSTDKAEFPNVCWSVDRSTKTNKMFNIFTSNTLDFVEDKKDSSNDSVFIDDNQKDDEFLLNDAHEAGLLDCTPQPDWPDLDDSESKEKESPKANTENVFKTINKMFPNNDQPESEAKPKSSTSGSTSSRSKEAKEILQNLSEIFNSSRRSDKQKSEGRTLIKNLVDILNNSQRSQDLEDSGHSSNVDNDSPEKDTIKSDILSERDDIEKESGSSNSSEKKRRLSLPLVETGNSQTSVKHKARSSSSAENKDQRISSALGTKLKSKPLNGGKIKGPMRAVIPVEDMKKVQKGQRLQTHQNRELQFCNQKKTSTPLNEPRPKPLAASTPSGDSVTSNASPKMARKFKSARVSSSNDTIENGSDKGQKKYEKPNLTGIRRSSFSKEPIRKGSTPTGPTKMIRQNSFSEEMISNRQTGCASKVQSKGNGIKEPISTMRNGSTPTGPTKMIRQNSVGEEMISNLRTGCASKVQSKGNGIKEPISTMRNGSTPTGPTKMIRQNSVGEEMISNRQTGCASKVQSKGNGIKEPISTIRNGSIPKGPTKMIRRNSVSEGMVSNQSRGYIPKFQSKGNGKQAASDGKMEGEPKLKRSNSLGKENGMMSTLRQIRENILKSPYYNKKSGILIDSNIKTDARVEKKVSFSDLDDSFKSKKNKENVCP